MQAMDAYMLSITICICFLFETSLSMKCAESIPTISTVSRCPSNATEWDIAAKRKGCNVLARIQNCTHANNFVYHCVLNEKATMLVEVCAPIYYLAGYCSRYSEVDGKFINKPDLDCTVFDPPCPNRFTSNESYKYQKCYEKVIKQQQEKNNVNQYVPLVTVLAITITLLMVLAVGLKLKWIKCLCGKKHGSKEEEIVKECKNLSGGTQVTCALQASSAILDLRNALSKELNIPQTLILIVDQENGTIFQDDIEIETLKQSPIEFILGNRNRTSIIEDDGSVENNVISNKNITYGKCKMSCGHFTDPETLFVWTKEKLPGGLHSRLLCPRCPYMLWGIDELVEKCNMSADEIMFFKNVAILNKRTVEFQNDSPDIKSDHFSEKMVKECKNLTESTKVTCTLQASSAILDLRNALSKELNIPQTLILIVDQENGTIFQDDIEIETLKQSPIEFILGNRNRTSIIEDDGSVENNVISNKNITYGKCKMSCGHFTDPETLFVWTKEKLPGGLHSGLPCPRCPYMLWGIDELVEKCNMSADETMFFKNVAILNIRSRGMFDYFESPKLQRSVSKQQTDKNEKHDCCLQMVNNDS